jgi:hypothetical protein
MNRLLLAALFPLRFYAYLTTAPTTCPAAIYLMPERPDRSQQGSCQQVVGSATHLTPEWSLAAMTEHRSRWIV